MKQFDAKNRVSSREDNRGKPSLVRERTEILVVYGPEASGKSMHAIAFMDHFKADELMDDVFYPEALASGQRTLVLTNSSPTEFFDSLPHEIADHCLVQFMKVSAAIRELN